MNEQKQMDPSPEEGEPHEAGQPIPVEQPVGEAPPARRFRLTWPFAAGFFGWFLVNGALWFISTLGDALPTREGYDITFNLFIFPLNLITTFVLLTYKKTLQIGLGILAAFAVNLIISLILGVAFNAFCLVPFFTR